MRLADVSYAMKQERDKPMVDNYFFLLLQNSDHFWPGLGGTDRDYAWTLTSFFLFEAGSLPLVMAIMDRLPYTVLIQIMMLLNALSGVVYATATDVWMVILARCLMGSATMLFSSVVFTYIGEMGTIMDQVRQKKGKPQRKNLLYLLALIATTLANALIFFLLSKAKVAFIVVRSLLSPRSFCTFLLSLIMKCGHFEW